MNPPCSAGYFSVSAMYSSREPAPLPIACAYSIHRNGLCSAGGSAKWPSGTSSAKPRSMRVSLSWYSGERLRSPICVDSSIEEYISENTSTYSAA